VEREKSEKEKEGGFTELRKGGEKRERRIT